jgi:hypothetical protein
MEFYEAVLGLIYPHFPVNEIIGFVIELTNHTIPAFATREYI